MESLEFRMEILFNYQWFVAALATFRDFFQSFSDINAPIALWFFFLLFRNDGTKKSTKSYKTFTLFIRNTWYISITLTLDRHSWRRSDWQLLVVCSRPLSQPQSGYRRKLLLKCNMIEWDDETCQMEWPSITLVLGRPRLPLSRTENGVKNRTHQRHGCRNVEHCLPFGSQLEVEEAGGGREEGREKSQLIDWAWNIWLILSIICCRSLPYSGPQIRWWLDWSFPATSQMCWIVPWWDRRNVAPPPWHWRCKRNTNETLTKCWWSANWL